VDDAGESFTQLTGSDDAEKMHQCGTHRHCFTCVTSSHLGCLCHLQT